MMNYINNRKTINTISEKNSSDAKKRGNKRKFRGDYRQGTPRAIQLFLRPEFYQQIKFGRKIDKKIHGREKMKVADSEKRTRTYVTDTLKELGWNIKKPQKGGNLLQEGEAQKYDDRIKEALKTASKTGKDRGLLDFLLVNSNKELWGIIETKPDRTEIEEAVKDAKHYVKFLNDVGSFNIKIIIGVAGNEEEGVSVENYFLKDGKWEIITSHGQPLTQILNIEQFEALLKNDEPSLDIKVPPLQYLYKRADKINKILHKHKVEESARAKVVASIILAMYQGSFSSEIDLVIQDINTRVKEALKGCKSPEQIFSMLELNKHDKLLAKSIPLVIHELRKANIHALMKSGYDVLGTFYEVFLKYGGDNKQLGIIFTPRHITDFACELIDLSIKDKVYDPTCGTGGFLVSAFNKFRELVNNDKKKVKEIGDTQIFGNDTSTSAYPLSVVNMIFRGDGKNNIIFQDCFEYPEEKQFTKVLMNPPFQTDADDIPEPDFIDHALGCLDVGGLLLAVVPISVLCESNHKKWRIDLIKKNTLEAIFTLPDEAFYPVGTITSLILIKAHIPQINKKVFFCKIEDDGFIKKKGKRIRIREGQFRKALDYFKNKKEEPIFSCYKNLKSYQSIVEQEEVKVRTKNGEVIKLIDKKDKDGNYIYKFKAEDEEFEIMPEAYLDDKRYSETKVKNDIESMMKEYIIFKIRHHEDIEGKK